MNIGEASSASGVSAKMIHYEALGLVQKVARTDSGYRQYGAHDLHTLRFIGRARDLGFSIDEIRELLRLWQDRRRSSAQVKALATKHVRELEARIDKMIALKSSLEHLISCCKGDHRPSCPIIDDLSDDSATARPVPAKRPGRLKTKGAGLQTVRRRARAA